MIVGDPSIQDSHYDSGTELAAPICLSFRIVDISIDNSGFPIYGLTIVVHGPKLGKFRIVHGLTFIDIVFLDMLDTRILFQVFDHSLQFPIF